MARILVIEDDSGILENILETLEYENFEVQGAYNGRDGLRMVETFQPDLIICDVMMPDLDGYGVLQSLRETRRTPEIPFIFLTAKGTREDMRFGMNLGADDYLAKPFRPQELLSLIHARLGLREIRQQQVATQMGYLRASMAQSLPHEFRTPLSSILGYSSMLEEDFETFEPEMAKEMLGAITRAGERLHRLVENYLLYAHISIYAQDAQKLAFIQQQSTTDADFISQDVASEVATQFNRQGDLHLSVEGRGVQVSATDFEKIIRELVENACKFSKSGTPITLTCGEVGGQYQVEVKDLGRGMTAEQVQKIGAFQQFDRQIYEQQGMGLGLAIVQGLAKLYGGDFRIESQPNQGTQVIVKLPLTRQ